MDYAVVGTYAAKEYVLDINMCTHTVKERSRATVRTLPFHYLQKMILQIFSILRSFG